MTVIAIGLDLVSVGRIAAMIDDHGQQFLERVFTEAERAYAGDRRRRDEHLAARFAAKEAILKALGTGLDNGITWTDVEVTRDPTGRPGVVLHNKALETADQLGITRWLITLTHTDDNAAAAVVALGDLNETKKST